MEYIRELPLVGWVPVVFVLAISITSVLKEVRMKKLIGFYVVMFAGVIAGAFIGGITNLFYGPQVGDFVGILAGGIVGFVAGMYYCGFVLELPGTFAPSCSLIGGILNAIIGFSLGALGGIGDYTAVLHFSAFLLAVEVVSFCIAQIIKFLLGFKESVKLMINWRDG